MLDWTKNGVVVNNLSQNWKWGYYSHPYGSKKDYKRIVWTTALQKKREIDNLDEMDTLLETYYQNWLKNNRKFQ